MAHVWRRFKGGSEDDHKAHGNIERFVKRQSQYLLFALISRILPGWEDPKFQKFMSAPF